MAGTEEQKEGAAILAKLNSSEGRELYEKALARWDKKLKPLIDANRESQRITAEDLAIIVY